MPHFRKCLYKWHVHLISSSTGMSDHIIKHEQLPLRHRLPTSRANVWQYCIRQSWWWIVLVKEVNVCLCRKEEEEAICFDGIASKKPGVDMDASRTNGGVDSGECGSIIRWTCFETGWAAAYLEFWLHSLPSQHSPGRLRYSFTALTLQSIHLKKAVTT